MNEPILVLLAAGMGSRYGGLKQIDPMGPNGEILMDYSLYDARQAGFKRVVFIIKKEIEKDFEERIGSRIKRYFDVAYAFQSLDDIPAGYTLHPDRVKPLGTAHALYAARDLLDVPFAVVNSDDYYGKVAYRYAYDYLKQTEDPDEALMVNYILGNTLSKNGHVARGICSIDAAGYLQTIVERRMVRDAGEQAEFSEDGGESWTAVDKKSPVSMNFWGFAPQFMEIVKSHFQNYLDTSLVADPMKGEYLIPTLVDDVIREGLLKVKTRLSEDSWYGVTYKEDKPTVQADILRQISEGLYPEKLWS